MRRTLAALVVGGAMLISGREAQATESSLGVGLGYVKANRVDATLFFTGDFRFHLSKTFALAPEFSYWKKSQSSLDVTASIEDLQFGVNAVAVLRAGHGAEVFLGGGGGLHHATGALAVGGAAASNSITKGGVDVLGGFDIKAGDSLSFFLAARYDWVLGLSGGDVRRLDQTKLYGGFRVRF